MAMIDTVKERDTFTVLYQKYKYLMLKVANDVLRDFALAEDAVHESFIKLASNSDLLKNRDVNSVQTKRLLITIARNCAIDIYRKRSKRADREISLDHEEYEGLVTFDHEEADNRVLDAIRELPLKYREVFALKYSNQYENREIAKLLGISEEAVRKRLWRGKDMIQEKLDMLSGGQI